MTIRRPAAPRLRRRAAQVRGDQLPAPQRPPDAVSILTIYIVLLLAIPSDRYIPGVGSIGSPAALWGVVAGLWWLWHQLQRIDFPAVPIRRPVRVAVLCLFIAVLLGYFVAMMRPIPDAEVGPADNGLLRMISYTGLLLVATDGIPSLDRLLVLLRRLTTATAIFAVVGLAEFITKQSFIDQIVIPGLSVSTSYVGVEVRAGFIRSSSTASHPLEYATVLVVVLPIAVTLALYGARRHAVWRWLAALAIMSSLMVAGSRSSILGLLIVTVPLVFTWSRTIRLRMGGVLLAMLAAVYVLVPGMIGTLRYLFINAATDSSVVSRTDSFDLFAEQFARSPIFGRGFGTFLPVYRIFDNQYLQLLIEVGFAGTIALLALLVTAVVSALMGRGVTQRGDLLIRQLGVALAAGVAGLAVLSGFYDALSFSKAAGMMFLSVGLCGAYWQLAQSAAVSPRRRAA